MTKYRNKVELRQYLNQDAINAGLSLSLLQRFKRLIFPSYCYNYIRILRYVSYYRRKGNIYGLWYRILHIYQLKLAAKLGFFIPDDVFGPGLYLPHFGSIIVNPNSIIGKNCQINNNVVIGQVGGECPTIGDNVYIGPGAVISGNIKIADNSWIGANAVVTKDVLKQYSLVCGVPARVIKIKQRNWLDDSNCKLANKRNIEL